jgi:hypothetical protein
MNILLPWEISSQFDNGYIAYSRYGYIAYSRYGIQRSMFALINTYNGINIKSASWSFCMCNFDGASEFDMKSYTGSIDVAKTIADAKLIEIGWLLLNENDPLMTLL